MAEDHYGMAASPKVCLFHVAWFAYTVGQKIVHMLGTFEKIAEFQANHALYQKSDEWWPKSFCSWLHAYIYLVSFGQKLAEL